MILFISLSSDHRNSFAIALRAGSELSVAYCWQCHSAFPTQACNQMEEISVKCLFQKHNTATPILVLNLQPHHYESAIYFTECRRQQYSKFKEKLKNDYATVNNFLLFTSMLDRSGGAMDKVSASLAANMDSILALSHTKDFSAIHSFPV